MKGGTRNCANNKELKLNTNLGNSNVEQLTTKLKNHGLIKLKLSLNVMGSLEKCFTFIVLEKVESQISQNTVHFSHLESWV